MNKEIVSPVGEYCYKDADFKVKIDLSVVEDLVNDPALAGLLDETKKLISHQNSKSNKKPACEAEDMIAACVAWSITGSSKEAAKLCKKTITPVKINNWSKLPWWQAGLKLAKYYKDKQFLAELGGLQELAAARLRKRIESGEIHTKELITAVRQLGMEKREHSRSLVDPVAEDSTKQRLSKLSQELEKLSRISDAKDITNYATYKTCNTQSQPKDPASSRGSTKGGSKAGFEKEVEETR